MSSANAEAKIGHDDKDLVQLAGYYAYIDQETNKEIEINGKLVKVEHVEKTQHFLL